MLLDMSSEVGVEPSWIGGDGARALISTSTSELVSITRSSTLAPPPSNASEVRVVDTSSEVRVMHAS